MQRNSSAGATLRNAIEAQTDGIRSSRYYNSSNAATAATDAQGLADTANTNTATTQGNVDTQETAADDAITAATDAKALISDLDTSAANKHLQMQKQLD